MDYKTKTSLILPFKGTWLVSNGGRSPETNNHVKLDGNGPQNQLFAYDFRFENTGNEKSLQDFKAFGQEVLAPGSGIVVQVINGAMDILIGERDRSVGVGNAIIIDHRNGEYSLLCHFKYDSITSKVGDEVKRGQMIGLCGNTGNTTQPHIHFNLQDGPLMQRANGLPAQFEKIMVNGEEKLGYEPVRCEKVSNI
jgi:murein DD-endopeptidase MepM/ murein hydrolase activator NlpD